VFGNASGFGGGICNFADLAVFSSSFVANSADTLGGAIYTNNSFVGSTTIGGSTFSANSPDSISGAYVDGGGNTL
jgi:predicted outer membrane repeat protein